MNLQEKEQIVAQLQQSFQASNASFLVDYSGCTCKEMTKLRRELQPAGAKMLVVKNTLMSRAFIGTPAEELQKVLQNQTAVIWASDDYVGPAKVLAKFAKEKESFAVKGGVVEGKVVSSEDITAIATLPSREEVLSKLLALINAPATRLLQTINAPASSLARLLGAWKGELEKKQ